MQGGNRTYGTPLGQEDDPLISGILDAAQWIVEQSEYIAGGAQACAAVVPGATPLSGGVKGLCAGGARVFGWLSTGKAAVQCATDNRCYDYLLDRASMGAFRALRKTFKQLSPEQQRRMIRRLGLTEAGAKVVPKLHEDLHGKKRPFEYFGPPADKNCIAMGFDCN